MHRLITIAALGGLLAPGAASAIGILGFDHARPVKPQHFEAGLAAAAGDEVFNFYGVGRFGLLPDLEVLGRAGLAVVGEAVDETGFEADVGAKFRFLRQQDTGGAAELAVMGTGSILNTSNLFVLGVDPQLVASHHFQITMDRELFVGLGLGAAVTFWEDTGDKSKTTLDFLGTFTAGVDVVPRVRLSLEAKLRDDLTRLGLAVTYLF